MKKAVLFDFDGTLADTMGQHLAAWQMVLGPYCREVSAEEFYPLEGSSLHDIARYFSRGLNLSESDINNLVLSKKNLYSSREKAKLYPGVKDGIAELKERQVPIAIVTAGHFDQLSKIVPTEFLQLFDAVVTGDQVSNSKPHPEPYLTGSKRLGIHPAACIAVENSPFGVQSAKAAGFYCVGITSTVERSKLSHADEIVDSFQSLMKLVQDL